MLAVEKAPRHHELREVVQARLLELQGSAASGSSNDGITNTIYEDFSTRQGLVDNPEFWRDIARRLPDRLSEYDGRLRGVPPAAGNRIFGVVRQDQPSAAPVAADACHVTTVSAAPFSIWTRHNESPQWIDVDAPVVAGKWRLLELCSRELSDFDRERRVCYLLPLEDQVFIVGPCVMTCSEAAKHIVGAGYTGTAEYTGDRTRVFISVPRSEVNSISNFLPRNN
jgi:hypothetical protein